MRDAASARPYCARPAEYSGSTLAGQIAARWLVKPWTYLVIPRFLCASSLRQTASVNEQMAIEHTALATDLACRSPSQVGRSASVGIVGGRTSRGGAMWLPMWPISSATWAATARTPFGLSTSGSSIAAGCGRGICCCSTRRRSQWAGSRHGTAASIWRFTGRWCGPLRCSMAQAAGQGQSPSRSPKAAEPGRTSRAGLCPAFPATLIAMSPERDER